MKKLVLRAELTIFERLEEKDPQSEEVEDLATYLFGGANTLSFDKDGRVVLSPELQEAIGVTDQVVFMGRADRFYLLSPERSREVLEAARIRSREKHRGALAPRRRAPSSRLSSTSACRARALWAKRATR